MHNLTLQLIARAPTLLVIAAIAMFVAGLANALTTFQSMQGQGVAPVAYLFTFIFSALYQPVILVAWAAAVHYLSILATRSR